jgi:hypothetical protein
MLPTAAAPTARFMVAVSVTVTPAGVPSPLASV